MQWTLPWLPGQTLTQFTSVTLPLFTSLLFLLPSLVPPPLPSLSSHFFSSSLIPLSSLFLPPPSFSLPSTLPAFPPAQDSGETVEVEGDCACLIHSPTKQQQQQQDFHRAEEAAHVEENAERIEELQVRMGRGVGAVVKYERPEGGTV